MKQLACFLFLFPLILACQKEIELEIPPDDRLVVEALGLPGRVSVQVSNTRDLSGNFQPPRFPNATVYIQDTKGKTSEEQEVSVASRDYLGFNLPDWRWKSGDSIFLHVVTPGQHYVAMSTQPSPVRLTGTSIAPFQTPIASLEGGGYLITPKFRDPKGERNFYLVSFEIKGESTGVRFPLQDSGWDGQENSMAFPLVSYDVKKGDKCKVHVTSVDEAAYRYFYQLYQNSGIGQAGGPSPTDPPSNFSGDVLGVFYLFWADSRSFTIP